MNDSDPKSKGGRPVGDEPGTTLSTWIPSSEYDRLTKIAAAKGVSVSQLAREWLKQRRG